MVPIVSTVDTLSIEQTSSLWGEKAYSAYKCPFVQINDDKQFYIRTWLIIHVIVVDKYWMLLVFLDRSYLLFINLTQYAINMEVR